MNLHIFNPEHDIALAFNSRRQSMPHAAQELRMNLGWIPALWAKDGDVVLVDDVPFAVKAARRFGQSVADVLFLSARELKGLVFDKVLPWGWDLRIKTELEEAGVDASLLPSDAALDEIRQLSNRRQTSVALQTIRQGLEDDTCGESRYVALGEDMPSDWPKFVLKAPWSSSGRGIRYVDGAMTDGVSGWMKRVAERQGGVMIEPYYPKVKDFGVEFFAHTDGTVTYEGLSVFQTINGAYAGSILATDEAKMEMLTTYLSRTLLESVIEKSVGYYSALLRNRYTGPFGVDMMIVSRPDGNGFLLHPCVEINLRRTMGHVALSLTPQPLAPRQLMRIVHDVNYTLKTNDLENNFVQVY